MIISVSLMLRFYKDNLDGTKIAFVFFSEIKGIQNL